MKRFLAIFATWVGVVMIWVFWLLSGPKAAWALHHRFMWRPISDEFVKEVIFAPTTNSAGGAELVSFQDLENGQFKSRIFLPPEYFRGMPPGFTEQVAAFNKPHEYHLGEVSAAKILELDSNPSGTRFEISIFYSHGGEWRWRYRAAKDKVIPLEWYEIHDTAGLILLPLTLISWLVGIPFAIWGSRVLSRIRKRAKT